MDVVEPSTSLPVPTMVAPVDRRPVLLFTRTEGFAHDAIPVATEALRADLLRRGFVVVATDDPSVLTGTDAPFSAVVFLLTTGDVLDDGEQDALRAHVESGRGFVGVHSALDTEYEWPYYRELIGSWFARHPAVQQATVHAEASPSVGWPGSVVPPPSWTRTDEWYDTRTNPRSGVRVLRTVDEATYDDGGMGADHPIEWCRDVGPGRTFVSAMGHTQESWGDATFVAHIADAVTWAADPDARCVEEVAQIGDVSKHP